MYCYYHHTTIFRNLLTEISACAKNLKCASTLCAEYYEECDMSYIHDAMLDMIKDLVAIRIMIYDHPFHAFSLHIGQTAVARSGCLRSTQVIALLCAVGTARVMVFNT